MFDYVPSLACVTSIRMELPSSISALRREVSEVVILKLSTLSPWRDKSKLNWPL